MEEEPLTAKTGKLKICILSLYSYPLFNPACISPFGGSEVRVSLIAKELAKYPDLDVNVVVFDHGQPQCEERHGVTLHAWPGKHCPLRADNPWAGANLPECFSAGTQWVPGFRSKARLFVKAHTPDGLVGLVRKLRCPLAAVESRIHRSTAFFRRKGLFGSIQSHSVRHSDVEIYDRVGADIYVGHGNHDLTATLAYYSRRRGKKYVMISASDQDFIAAHNARTKSTDIYGQLGFLMVHTIENADLIIVQTRKQAELAQTHFGRETIVIPNPVDPALSFPRSCKPEKILWIGKSDDRVKQPDLFVDLARRKLEYEYLMIMSLAIDSVHRRILQKSNVLSNLKILTYVPHEQVGRYFADARLLVNTSRFEGFPDAFLQASKYGVPIVSLQVDPDGMLSEQGCGLVSGGDFERLVQDVSLLMSDISRCRQIAGRSRTYLTGHHDKSMLIPKYREAMLGLSMIGRPAN